MSNVYINQYIEHQGDGHKKNNNRCYHKVKCLALDCTSINACFVRWTYSTLGATEGMSKASQGERYCVGEDNYEGYPSLLELFSIAMRMFCDVNVSIECNGSQEMDVGSDEDVERSRSDGAEEEEQAGPHPKQRGTLNR